MLGLVDGSVVVDGQVYFSSWCPQGGGGGGGRSGRLVRKDVEDLVAADLTTESYTRDRCVGRDPARRG